MRAEGGPAEQLTRGGYSARMDYAPDGSRIAYQVHDDVGFDIQVMPARGGPGARLTTAADDETGPRWSPDGTRVAFLSGAAPDRELHIAGAGGGPATRLTREGDVGGFDWLPDGSGLVYSLTEAAANLWRVDVEELLRSLATGPFATGSWTVFGPGDRRWQVYSSRSAMENGRTIDSATISCRHGSTREAEEKS